MVWQVTLSLTLSENIYHTFSSQNSQLHVLGAQIEWEEIMSEESFKDKMNQTLTTSSFWNLRDNRRNKAHEIIQG